MRFSSNDRLPDSGNRPRFRAFCKAETLNNETQISSARFDTRATRKKREEKIERKERERRVRSRDHVSPRRRCDVRLRFRNRAIALVSAADERDIMKRDRVLSAYWRSPFFDSIDLLRMPTVKRAGRSVTSRSPVLFASLH
jgi:hypothetical protein